MAMDQGYCQNLDFCKSAIFIASRTTLGVKMQLYNDIWIRISKYDTLRPYGLKIASKFEVSVQVRLG